MLTKQPSRIPRSKLIGEASEVRPRTTTCALSARMYNPIMAKKITLSTLANQMQKMDQRMEKTDQRLEKMDQRMEKGFALMEKGFSAVADDISKLATKEDVAAVSIQVNSIERQLRETKANTRLSDLEEKVFGAPRH